MITSAVSEAQSFMKSGVLSVEELEWSSFFDTSVCSAIEKPEKSPD